MSGEDDRIISPHSSMTMLLPRKRPDGWDRSDAPLQRHAKQGVSQTLPTMTARKSDWQLVFWGAKGRMSFPHASALMFLAVVFF